MIYEFLAEWACDLRDIFQNRPLQEAKFVEWAVRHGFGSSAEVERHLGVLNGQERFWPDRDDSGKLEYHPFRVCDLKFPSSAAPNNEGRPELSISELAILIEPIHWPKITGIQKRNPILLSENEFRSKLECFRQAVLDLVAQLDPEIWKNKHHQLRGYAADLDDNNGLYLLLRCSNWKERKKLVGPVAGALWVRQIAEVIRRGFEEVHGVRWSEEDQYYEMWPGDSRKQAYGSDRPLDQIVQTRPIIARRFGLWTGSLVRWYVEGETEYFAILETLPDPEVLGIELVNLRGNLRSEKDNIALKLRDGLELDRSLGRFSMISFDADVQTNVKAINKQVKENRVVGLITAHKPDFEFSNFAIDELVEIATSLVPGESDIRKLREAGWEGVESADSFSKTYQEAVSSSLKGESWGRALARYAKDHPNRADSKIERPFCGEIRAALQARLADYSLQKERFYFAPDTFELRDREAEGETKTG